MAEIDVQLNFSFINSTLIDSIVQLTLGTDAGGSGEIVAENHV